jgi:hypothetical protein
MRAEGAQQGTDDDGRMTPIRGEGGDNDSWHGAREGGWNTAACEKAKDGARTEPVSAKRASRRGEDDSAADRDAGGTLHTYPGGFGSYGTT